MQIILASSSQGRRQLLSLFKIPFKIIPANVDEDKIIAKRPLETIKLRARLKGEYIAKNLKTYNLKPKTFLIISADSGAILDNELIGKPKNEKEAKEILSILSGKTHEFVTAIYTIKIKSLRGGKSFEHTHKEKIWSTYDRSFVTMRKLSIEDIKLHLKLSDYTKYAGGYALFASPIDLITKVEGSLTNVVGLPLEKLIPILRENKILKLS